MKTNLFALSFMGAFILISSCKKTDINDPVSKILTSQISLTNKTFSSREAGGQNGGVTAICTTCLMTYPDNSNLPRSGQVFSENEMLVAAEPGTFTCSTQPTQIKVWYADEHPLCLGIRQVIIKTKTKSDTTRYPITPSPISASSITNPMLGATDQSGDYAGNDVATDGGRPLWPALYITDLGTNPQGDLSSRAGDWQQSTPQHPSIAYAPSQIYGMWKSGIKIIDKTRTPAIVTIQMDADSKKGNGWNLADGQLPPAGTIRDKFGAMVAWDVNKLGLLPGHIYRLQFMVHDGDQNKSGGDVGQSCTTIIMPD